MFENDVLRDRQAQPGAPARPLGGEERLEDTRQIGGRNAGTVVGYLDLNAFGRRLPAADGDRALAGDRVQGIAEQDREQRLEEVAVRQDPFAGSRVRVERHARPLGLDRRGQETHDAADQRADFLGLLAGRRAPAELEQAVARTACRTRCRTPAAPDPPPPGPARRARASSAREATWLPAACSNGGRCPPPCDPWWSASPVPRVSPEDGRAPGCPR